MRMTHDQGRIAGWNLRLAVPIRRPREKRGTFTI
jgi:hypothetical protein